jgi:hypothetical protein
MDQIRMRTLQFSFGTAPAAFTSSQYLDQVFVGPINANLPTAIGLALGVRPVVSASTTVYVDASIRSRTSFVYEVKKPGAPKTYGALPNILCGVEIQVSLTKDGAFAGGGFVAEMGFDFEMFDDEA